MWNLTEEVECDICSSEKRDKIQGVVENPTDVIAIESSEALRKIFV